MKKSPISANLFSDKRMPTAEEFEKAAEKHGIGKSKLTDQELAADFERDLRRLHAAKKPAARPAALGVFSDPATVARRREITAAQTPPTDRPHSTSVSPTTVKVR